MEYSADVINEFLIPFGDLLKDPQITEIAVNRPREIWVEDRDGWRSLQSENLDFQYCRRLATLVATFNGKAIDEERSIISGSLPGGERIQVVIPPACEPGTVSMTIRKPSMLDKTLEELDSEGSFQECAVEEEYDLKPFERELLELKSAGRIREFLHMAVRMKRNILISGKTGSGKTTITKSLTRSIPSDERLVTIEDVHELFLNHHNNFVHLFYSRSDEGGKVVTAKQVLASCLRMKPDRILLAELRGDEAWEYIKSINTGHPGSITTMHANGAYESFDQLTALIKDSPTGAHLDASYIRQRLMTTLDIILFYDRRKLREIYYNPELKRQSYSTVH
jgi:type IV secretion system protein VirB11